MNSATRAEVGVRPIWSRFDIGYRRSVLALTKLEIAVMRSIFAETPMLEAALLAQLQHAKTADRENTGAGFFTKLHVDDEANSIDCPRVLGNETLARVEGLSEPMGFVLFTKNGRLDLLEGFTFGPESTADLDLQSVEFELFRQAPTPRPWFD